MKIIVIDDDPTGSQTVSDCLLLLRWDHKTLLKGFNNNSKIFFILANTRSLSEDDARERIQEICINLSIIIRNKFYEKEKFILISRGDSTLRGHNFLEPYIINRFLGPFDATFHIPAFIEGNRITIEGNHFVEGIPAHYTIFARDKIFGYKTNNLRTLLYEKSNSKLSIDSIKNLTVRDLELLNITPENNIFKFIKGLNNNQQIIVDATNYSELNKLSNLFKKLREKKFLFRTSASFISSILNSNTNNLKKSTYSELRRKNNANKYMPGIIIIGSYVDKTTRQLNKMLKISSCKALELNILNLYQLFNNENNYSQLNYLKKSILNTIQRILASGQTPVLYTSRNFLVLDNESKQIKFQKFLSSFIAKLVADIKFEIGYLISKGGITTNTILSEGFNIDSVYLEGQILAGISLITVDLMKLKSKIPIVTFPGNIGEEDDLVKVWKLLENKIKV